MDLRKKASKISSIFLALTGKKLDLSIYPDRIMLQKIVYLFQEEGVNFGYHFNWYVKGPYSISLTKDLFDTFKEKLMVHSIELNNKEKSIAEKMRLCFGKGLSDENYLEILGSLVFIRNEGLSASGKVVDSLISRKPWLERAEVEEVYEDLQKSGLFCKMN